MIGRQPLIGFALVIWSLPFNLAHLQAAELSFRSGQPEVMPQSTSTSSSRSEEADQQLLKAFGSTYRSLGSPTVALFWNRELAARLETQRLRSRTVTHTERTSSMELQQGSSDDQGGFISFSERDGGSNKREEFVERDGAVDAGAGTTLDTRYDVLLRSAFVATLQQAKLRLLDRALLMHAAAEADSSTSQAEIQGLKRQARWMLEVLPIPDAQAPNGLGFQIRVKEIHTARLLADFYSEGLPRAQPAAARPFVATSGGFKRMVPSQTGVTPTSQGRALALQLLSQLTALGAGIP